MARTDRFMIAPIETGLQTDLKPWLIPDDAFQTLTNVYLFRGRVRKRLGTILMNQTVQTNAQLHSRLRINLGNTSGGGALSGTVPGSTFAVGQLFSIGDNIFTVSVAGTPAVLLTTGAATGTYNTTTGAFAFIGATAATPVYFYPATAVVGFSNYNNASINNEPLFAFDTQFAYQYTGGAWNRLSAEATPGASVWTGNDFDLFWTQNWRGADANDNYLYVTNYNFGNTLNDSDTMRIWNGTQWSVYNPGFDASVATSTIVTARIIVPFHRRLILLNVVENTGMSPGVNNVYPNRVRWSWIGDPTNAAAFYENGNGNGGYLDAPTNEEIITAQFLKDRLIVYFQSSTWELVWTGNEIQPFNWQQLNTELGCESTFSQVPFDKVVLGIGNVGIHACNGSNVDRIDNKIPDDVFAISNDNQGIYRVYGIRDYFTELVYWSFPAEDSTQTYPNRILVYNYKTGSWSFFIDSVTAFGYYQQQTDLDWQDYDITWQQASQNWNSATMSSRFKQVVAGNQQGFTFLMTPDANYNEETLQITNIVNAGPVENGTLVTVGAIDHNLVEANQSGTVGDFVLIEDCGTITGINTYIYAVQSVIDNNNFTIVVPTSRTVAGNYTGGGVIARISNIRIVTKQYNFYVSQGRNSLINKVDFLVSKTPFGEVTVDYYVSSSNESQLTQGNLTQSTLGTGTLDTFAYDLVPLEAAQERLWHPIYPLAEGECIQLEIYLKDDPDIDQSQIRDPLIAFSGFALHGMTFYTQPTASRLQ